MTIFTQALVSFGWLAACAGDAPRVGAPVEPPKLTKEVSSEAVHDLVYAFLDALQAGDISARPVAMPFTIEMDEPDDTNDRDDVERRRVVATFTSRDVLNQCVLDACEHEGVSLWGAWQVRASDGERAPLECTTSNTGPICCDVTAVSRSDLGLEVGQVCVEGNAVTSIFVRRDGF